MSLEDAITKLVSRLETVTARLEKVEGQLAVGGAPASATAVAAPSGGASSTEVPPNVQAFVDLINEHIPGVIESAGKVGGELPQMTELLQKVIDEHKKIIHVAALSKKPQDADFAKLVAPMLEAAQAISTARDSKESRASKLFNHISTISEALACFNWIAIAPTPVPYLNETIGSSEFYSNRVLKEYKGKDETHVTFVTGFNSFLRGLQAYVKQYHTTGLAWNNASGGDALANANSLGTSAPSASTPAGPKLGNVFSSLGENVTSGLKKVTADMKSKNRSDAPLQPKAAPKPKPAGAAQPKRTIPAKCELNGNKWEIEGQSGNETTIDVTDFKQTAYIYKCDNAVIKINGKLNVITLDACNKTALIFDTAIAAFEVVNCNGVKIQINDSVPSISVDKSTNYQLFLSKNCLNADIVTSKSSEGNVTIPGKTEEDDPIELPVPEQYITKVVNFGLSTEPVKHTGV